MKKKIAALLCVIILVSLCGCARQTAPSSEPEPYTGMANPMVESSPEDIMNTLGVSFVVPEGAKDVQYFIISGEMAHMMFTLDGVECIARIKPTAEAEDISGMYFEAKPIKAEVGRCPANVMLAEDEGKRVGFCTWFDAAPGISYCVVMRDGADAESLLALAEAVYEPMQDDAG